MPPRGLFALSAALVASAMTAPCCAQTGRPPASESAADEARAVPPQFPRAEQEPRKISRTTPSRSDDGAATDPKPPRPTGSPWSIGGPLVLILIVVGAGATLWKRHGVGVVPGIPRDAVEVLGRRPLDPRTTLWLVRLGSKILVFGVSPAGISTLTEVSDAVEVDLLAGLCKRGSSDAGLGDTFRTLFSGPTRAAPPPVRNDEKNDVPPRSRESAPTAEAFARRLKRAARDEEDAHAA